MRNRLSDRLAAIFYPARCTFCGRVAQAGTVCCESCKETIERIEPPLCPMCGSAVKDCTCGRKKHAFERVAAPFYYTGPVRRAIGRFKFEGKTQAANVLAGQMAKTVRREYGQIPFDLLVCVPLGPSRLKARGYNQSALLARRLAELLDIPFSAQALVKQFDTREQHLLSSDERRGNVLGAFSVPKSEIAAGKTILLCDDIKTTGATMHECAQMLLLAGAAAVYGICVAIPLLEHP